MGSIFVMTDSVRQSDESSVTARLKAFANNVSRFADNASEDQQESLLALLEEWELLGLLEHWERTERRKAPRKECSLLVHYVASKKMFSDVVTNISVDGAFMETCAFLTVGQPITMIFSPSDHEEPINVTASVVRTTDKGVGLEFKTANQDLERMIASL